MKNYKIMAAAVVCGLALSTVTSKAGYIVPTNGLIGYWPGNGSAIDVSPTGNNGSFGGSYAPGPPVGGEAFNLGIAYVSIPNNAVYDNFTSYSGWSVGFWFNGNGSTINRACPQSGYFVIPRFACGVGGTPRASYSQSDT
jgi:hypothetical protein